MSKKPNLNQRRRMEDLANGDGMIISGGKIPILIAGTHEEPSEEMSHHSLEVSPPIATNLGSIVENMMRGYDIERGGGF